MAATIDELRDAVRAFLCETANREYRRYVVDNNGHPSLLERIREFGFFSIFDELEHLGVAELLMVAEECGYALIPDRLIDLLLFGPFLFRYLSRSAATTAPRPLVEALCVGSLSGVVHHPKAPAEGTTIDSELSSAVICPYVPTPFLYVELPHGEVPGSIYQVTAAPSARQTADPLVSIIPLSRITLGEPLSSFTFSPANSTGEVLLPYPWIVHLSRLAEAIGAARWALDTTLAYVTTREQFGVPVGGFQALQQGIAESACELARARALLSVAGQRSDEADPSALTIAAAVDVLARRDLQRLAERTIQYHGGIGFTWEYDLHLALRRIILLLGVCQPPESTELLLLRRENARLSLLSDDEERVAR